MDNDIIKNIVQQFPFVAFIIGCIGSFIWFIKSIMDIRSRILVSNINKEVLKITLSSVKSQELIKELAKLQKLVSDFDQYVSETNVVSSPEIESFKKRIEALANELPDDWKNQNEIRISQNWLENFWEMNESIKGANHKKRSESNRSVDKLSSKSTIVFYAIEELIQSIVNHKKRTESAVNWIAAVKGAGAFSILVVCSLGLLSTINVQKKMQLASQKLNDRNRSYQEKIERLVEERSKAKHQLVSKTNQLKNLSDKLNQVLSTQKKLSSLNPQMAASIAHLEKLSNGLEISLGSKKVFILKFYTDPVAIFDTADSFTYLHRKSLPDPRKTKVLVKNYDYPTNSVMFIHEGREMWVSLSQVKLSEKAVASIICREPIPENQTGSAGANKPAPPYTKMKLGEGCR